MIDKLQLVLDSVQIRPLFGYHSRIRDPVISHCLMQWIRPRTGLCGGCGRRMALRNFELHARNDDDDDDDDECFTI